jgi:copper oxidase (laccase) domain-containing protein
MERRVLRGECAWRHAATEELGAHQAMTQAASSLISSAAADPANARFFATSGRPGHAMFDLPLYLAHRLAADGVGKVVNLSLCTFGDAQRFFSYRRATHRRETDYGRLISAIALT